MDLNGKDAPCVFSEAKKLVVLNGISRRGLEFGGNRGDEGEGIRVVRYLFRGTSIAALRPQKWRRNLMDASIPIYNH